MPASKILPNALVKNFSSARAPPARIYMPLCDVASEVSSAPSRLDSVPKPMAWTVIPLSEALTSPTVGVWFCRPSVINKIALGFAPIAVS